MAPSKKDLQNAVEQKDEELKKLKAEKSDIEQQRRQEGAQSQLKLDEATGE